MSEFGTVIIPDNIVRDFSFSVVNAGNYIFDITQQGNAIGLDFWINNNGAAPITVSWNGLPAITIAAGAAFGMTATKWWILQVVAAVNYDLVMAGITRAALVAKGALP